MLYSTHSIAGMMGSRSARARLSPSAISAICCALKAGPQEIKVETMVLVIKVEHLELIGDLKGVKLLGMSLRVRREIGFVVGL